MGLPRAHLIKYAIILLVAAVGLAGIGEILLGVGFLRFNAVFALIILLGLIDLGIAALLFPLYGRVALRVRDFLEDPKLVMVAYAVIFYSFMAGVFFTAARAYVGGVTIIIGTILAGFTYYAWSKEVIKGPGGRTILGIIAIIAGIFLAIGGFMTGYLVVTAHVGVASIAIILAGIAGLSTQFMKHETAVKLGNVVTYLISIIFAAALVVGGALTIWGAATRVGAGGLITAAASLGLIGGIATLVSGILILILSLTQLIAMARGAPARVEGPPPEAPQPPPPPPPPPPE